MKISELQGHNKTTQCFNDTSMCCHTLNHRSVRCYHSEMWFNVLSDFRIKFIILEALFITQGHRTK